jgi:hypothetical protein
MSNPTSNFGWVMPTATDLVTDLPADFAVFGQAVDTSMADLKGGTTGQILSKATSTDMDFTWITNDVGDITAVTAGTGISGGGTSGAVTITNSMQTTITTAGDVLYGTGSAAVSRLGIGTAGQVLAVNSGATAPEWVSAAASGLTLITRQTYTTAGTVNVNDVFSATYDNYFVVCKNSAASAGSNINMRLRVGGADNSTANYSIGSVESNNAGMTNRYNTGQTSFFATTLDQSAIWSCSMLFINPFLATTTSLNFSNGADNAGWRTATGTGYFNASTSFTGFSLLPQASATMTGVVAVYGYKI